MCQIVEVLLFCLVFAFLFEFQVTFVINVEELLFSVCMALGMDCMTTVDD